MKEEQVKELLFEKFLHWMRGQTCSLNEDGSTNYYECDVNAYIEKITSGYDRQNDSAAWD